MAHLPVFASVLVASMGGIVLDAAWRMSKVCIFAPELGEAGAGQTTQLTKRFVGDGRYASDNGKDDTGGDQALKVGIDLSLGQVGHFERRSGGLGGDYEGPRERRW